MVTFRVRDFAEGSKKRRFTGCGVHTVIPGLWSHEFETSQVYTVSFRLARATQWDHLIKTNTTPQKSKRKTRTNTTGFYLFLSLLPSPSLFLYWLVLLGVTPGPLCTLGGACSLATSLALGFSSFLSSFNFLKVHVTFLLPFFLLFLRQQADYGSPWFSLSFGHTLNCFLLSPVTRLLLW